MMATTAEYGLGEYTYPRGWFMVARSEEIGTTPTAVRFFGEDTGARRAFTAQRKLLAGAAWLMRFMPAAAG